jgi:hypothetical protein
MRGILAVVAGIVAGFAATILIGLVAGMIVPRPARLEGFSGEQLIGAFPGLPMAAKIAIVLSWFGGALAGAAVAKLIARKAWPAWTATGFFTLYVLLTTLVLPMPGWLQATAVVGPLIGGLIANHLVAGRDIAEEATAAEPGTGASL